jgi:hypothetical protein
MDKLGRQANRQVGRGSHAGRAGKWKQASKSRRQAGTGTQAKGRCWQALGGRQEDRLAGREKPAEVGRQSQTGTQTGAQRCAQAGTQMKVGWQAVMHSQEEW